ncbi:MAG: putative DNA binding domain-containing protein [Muribaculaceae bacterium]|nr:putative DNA binding domain-containing protein [Muribaculaceae bacterium]
MDSFTTLNNAFKRYLDHLIFGRETYGVEFKHGRGGFPHKEFWPSYSSFANTEGGTIIIGVKEKNGNFYPEGLSKETVEHYEKIFWDSVNDPNQVSRKLMTNKDVLKEEYNGNGILIFNVPRATREERPVYVGQNPMRGTYRRNASGDYLCKEWEVAIMLAEQRPKLAMDAEILEGFSMDDIDKESLRGFRQLFMTLKPTHPWTEDDDLTLLKHIKAYGKDRVTGKEGLTLSGLLMFGKYDSITDAIPQFMIDYREYTPGSERWSDRIYNDGSWESNLYQAYRKILPRVQSFLPVPFKLDGNERIDETKAHKALREAFVNLCVHASYQSDSKLLILKYPDRIIFSNPGTMLVSKEQYFSGGESICRNPSLQTMFSMIGAVEKAGSGADTITQGWNDAKFGTPIISEKSEPNKVELILPILSIDSVASDGNSEVYGNSNVVSDGNSKGDENSNVASNVASNIASNVASKQHKRKSYEELSILVMNFCKTWKTRQEIAMALGYKQDYLRNNVLPRMIADGLLEKLDKEWATNPNQKYRSTQEK